MKPNVGKKLQQSYKVIHNPAQMVIIDAATEGKPRRQKIVMFAKENKTSADIAGMKICHSNSDRNKGQPLTARTIRNEMVELSKEVGFKVTIHSLNIYGQMRRIPGDN